MPTAPTLAPLPRHLRHLLAVGLALVALAGLTPARAARKPAIELGAALPSCAAPGETIRLTGRGLKKIKFVDVGGIATRPLGKKKQRTDSEVRIQVPATAQAGAVALRLRKGKKPLLDAAGLFQVGCGEDLTLTPGNGAPVTTNVDATGGTVTATAGGASLALVVPAGALAAATGITLTPLAHVAGLPFSDGVVTAVRFEPEGLAFTVPAALRVELPADAGPGPFVAFRFDGDGRRWRAFRSHRDGNAVVLAVAHFSGGGVGRPSEADFVNAVRPILDQIGADPNAIVSVQVMNELRELEGAWEEMYPGFCTRAPAAPLCTRVEDVITTQVGRQVGQICPAPPATLPNVSRNAVSQVAALQGLLAVRGDLLSQEVNDCLHRILSELIAAAAADAIANPRAARLAELVDLAASAAVLGFDDLQQLATEKLDAAMGVLLQEIATLCAADVSAAVDAANLARDFASAVAPLRPTVQSDIDAALAHCPTEVVVNPTEVGMEPGTQVRFTAVIPTLAASRQGVAWNTTGAGNVIEPSGIFTAGSDGGTFTVTAQSAAVPSAVGTATVHVRKVDGVTIDPAQATVRPGDTILFRASVVGLGPVSPLVTWGALGDQGTGTVLLRRVPLTNGTFFMAARSVTDPGKAGLSRVVVSDAADVPSRFQFVVSCSRSDRVNNGPLNSAGVAMSAVSGERPFTVTVNQATQDMAVSVASNGAGGSVQVEDQHAPWTFSATVTSARGESGTGTVTITAGPDGFEFSGCDTVEDHHDFHPEF